MKIFKMLAPLIAVTIAAPAMADGVVLEANGARADERWGGELGLGYTLNVGRFALRPIGGAFIHSGDDTRYRRETTSADQSICRDTTNGQFAKSEDCINVAADWYAKAEATYTVPDGMEFGGGARFSRDRVRGYGTVAFAIGPTLRLKANVGDRYYALGLKAQFR